SVVACTWSFVIRDIPPPLSPLACRKSGSVHSARLSWIRPRSLWSRTRRLIDRPNHDRPSHLSQPQLASRLKQFAQSVQVLGTGVADHDIAKAVVAPTPDFEGKSCAGLVRVARPPLLEDKDRNLVLADAENKFRTRGLAQIRDPPAYQDERSTLQLGQVKGEGNLALEPWLYRVTIGGNDIHRVGAGECCHMLVDQFAHQLLFAVPGPVKAQKDCNSNQQRGGSRSYK